MTVACHKFPILPQTRAEARNLIFIVLGIDNFGNKQTFAKPGKQTQ